MTRLLVTTLHTVLIIAAVVLSLKVAGVSPSTILTASALASTISVAVTFALSAILQGFTAGHVIELERHFDVGDYLTALGVSGHVVAIHTRTTLLRDGTQTHVLPNLSLFTTVFTVGEPPKEAQPCSNSPAPAPASLISH